MNDTSLFVYSEELLAYKFNDEHPFNQKRLTLTLDLLKKHHAIRDDQIIKPRMATDEELELVHDRHYVNAVKLAGEGKLPSEKALNYGLGTEDTPIFPNMHEASALLVGGTLTAVDAVMTGKSLHALNLGGACTTAFVAKPRGFAFIMIVRSQSNTYKRNMGHVSCMSIRMPITAMGSNGPFTMIRMYARFPSMKRDATYFPARGR